MSDNPVSAAAEELKKWLETLEKILSKMEADKLAAGKAKLDGERFDAMMKELKTISKGAENGPPGPELDAFNKKVDMAVDKMNDLSPKTAQGMGRKITLEGKHVDPLSKNQGNNQVLKQATPSLKGIGK